MKMSIMRGLVLGGSLGIFFALYNGSHFILQTAFTGSIMGALAGFTAGKLAEKRNANKDK